MPTTKVLESLMNVGGKAIEKNKSSLKFIEGLCDEFEKYNYIDPAYYERYDVKRGLRNADGTGVMEDPHARPAGLPGHRYQGSDQRFYVGEALRL